MIADAILASRSHGLISVAKASLVTTACLQPQDRDIDRASEGATELEFRIGLIDDTIPRLVECVNRLGNLLAVFLALLH